MIEEICLLPLNIRLLVIKLYGRLSQIALTTTTIYQYFVKVSERKNILMLSQHVKVFIIYSNKAKIGSYQLYHNSYCHCIKHWKPAIHKSYVLFWMLFNSQLCQMSMLALLQYHTIDNYCLFLISFILKIRILAMESTMHSARDKISEISFKILQNYLRKRVAQMHS